MPDVNALQHGVSDEELIRRSHRLERDRVAATIMEPGLDYPGPGAMANAVSDAAGAPEMPTDAKDAAKKGMAILIDRALWSSVVSVFLTIPAIIGLDIFAAITKTKGWMIIKKLGLVVLNLLLLAMCLAIAAMVSLMLCTLESDCRSEIMPWLPNMIIGAEIWWLNL